MNNQLNKGVIELFILLLLKKTDNYGYELTKIASSNLNITEGAIYPVLRRLSKHEFLDVYKKMENNREKKYYHLNQNGEEYLENLKKEWKVIDTAISNYF